MTTSMGLFFKENQNINDYKKWILCPKCKIEIPEIQISMSKTTPQLLIRCICSQDTITMSLEMYLEYIKTYNDKFTKRNCSYNSRHFNNVAELYCIDCKMLLCFSCIKTHSIFTSNHQVINRDIHFTTYCFFHETIITTHYCLKCNIKICSECIKSSHSFHKKKEYCDLWKEINVKDIDTLFNFQKEKFKEKNKQLLTDLIYKIEKIIDELKESIQVIKREYETNEKINKQICDLIDIAISNFKTTKNTPNYNIIRSFHNFTKFSNDSSKINIEDVNYQALIKSTYDYFKNNYIIRPAVNYTLLKTIKHKDNKDKVTLLLELNDNRVATGLGNGVINIWDKSFQEVELTAKYHIGSINDMCQLANNILASCSMDSKIILYNISSTDINFHQILIGHKTGVCCLLIIDKTNNLLSSSYDNTMILWDVNCYQNLLTINEHGDAIMQCICLTDKKLVSCSLDETIRFWDLPSSTSCSCVQIKAHDSPVYSLLQLSNSILVSGGYRMIKLWDVVSYTCSGVMKRVEGQASKIIQLDEDRIISIGSNEGIMQIWDIKTLICVQRVLGHVWTIQSIICLKSGKYITGSKDSKIKIWELY